MSSVLHGLDGVLCQMVFGQDQEQHDRNHHAVLWKIEAAGATLKKCEFSKTSLKFLGHIIDQEGIRADPDKAATVREIKPPTSVPEVCRFMGTAERVAQQEQVMDLGTRPASSVCMCQSRG